MIMAFEKLKNFVTSSAVNLSLLFLLLYFTSTETIVDCPNAFGMSPLMIASQKGYTRFVIIRRWSDTIMSYWRNVCLGAKAFSLKSNVLEPTGSPSWRLSGSFEHEATRSITTFFWVGCKLPPAFHQASLTIGQYQFILLGGEMHRECAVFCLRTQHIAIPRPFGPESNTLTSMLQCLPFSVKGFDKSTSLNWDIFQESSFIPLPK